MSDNTLTVDNTIKKFTFFYKLYGVDINNKYTLKHKVRIIFNLVWLNSDLLGAAQYLIEGIKRGDDFINLTHTTPCISFSSLSFFRLYAHYSYRDKVEYILKSLRDLEKEVLEESNEQKNKVFVRDVSILQKLLKTFNIAYLISLTCFAMNPLLITIYTYLKYDIINLQLPFLITYPFDSHDIKYWPWVYLHQMYSQSVAISYLLITDYILYTYCSYITTHLRFLQIDFENIINDTGSGFQRDKFNGLVKRHSKLIRLTQMLDTIYTKNTLYNYLTGSVLICLTGFNIVMVTDIMVALNFVAFLLTSFLQVFNMCYFGDLLTEASTQIGDALYRSKWYLNDPAVVKDVQMVIMRSQRPCKLTANGYADVNLRSFMKILGNAWSYFALLKTMYN